MCRTCEARYKKAYSLGYAPPNFIPSVESERCELCGELGPVVADHSHVSGLFRGWLCTRCNTVLAQYFETPFATAALEYLRTAPARSEQLRSRQPRGLS